MARGCRRDTMNDEGQEDAQMKTEKTRVATTVGLSMLAVLLFTGTGRAQTCEQLATLMQTARGATLASLETSADADLDETVAQLDVAITALDEWLALAATEAGKACLGQDARSLIRYRAAARKNLAKARELYTDMAIQQDKRLKTTQKVVKTFIKADKKAFKRASDPAYLLQELKSRSAGFHYPDTVVCFKLQVKNLVASECPITATIVNPADDLGFHAVEPAGDVLIDQGGGQFCVTMGPNTGGARVDIVVCDEVVASRLLFNKGERPTALTFDGHYAGAYSGQIVIFGDGDEPDFEEPVGGGVGFTIVNRRVNVHAPAAGTGRIQKSGRAKFTAGAGSLTFAGKKVTYSGHLILTRSGAVIARGTWHVSFQGGKASGTWTATRP